MRGYECKYKILKSSGIIDEDYPYNIYCWAGIQKLLTTHKQIYIEDFEDTVTKDYIGLLISLINKITPCEIVNLKTKNGSCKSYIKYTFIAGYDNNLILLNFIRNLWNCPRKDQRDAFGNLKNEIENYTNDFFSSLSLMKMEDPLTMLLKANIEACKTLRYNHDNIVGPGHCNAFPSHYLKIKTTEDLLKYKGTSTRTFLTE